VLKTDTMVQWTPPINAATLRGMLMACTHESRVIVFAKASSRPIREKTGYGKK
jgi:hypothetical protein